MKKAFIAISILGSLCVRVSANTRYLMYTATATTGVDCSGKLNGGKLVMSGGDGSAYCADLTVSSVSTAIGLSTQTVGNYVASIATNASTTGGVTGAHGVGVTIGVDPSSGTLQGNTFNGATQLVQTNASSLIANANIDASSVTKQGNTFNTGSKLLQLSSGLVPNANVDASSVTKQGNIFNGASQLVQMNGSTQLPAVSGVNLTALNATQLTSGTVPNARLDSSSVTLLGPSINLSGTQVTGTLAAARMPALTGDVTTSAGSIATTVASFSVANGTSTLLNTTNLRGGGLDNIVLSSTGPAITGCTTGLAPAAGMYGQVISSITAAFTSMPTSNNWGDVATITLTTGCWMLSGSAEETANGATDTDYQCGYGLTAGNTAPAAPSGSNTAFGLTRFNPSTGATSADAPCFLPAYPVCVTSNTAYYFKILGVFSVATPKYSGGIYAIRKN